MFKRRDRLSKTGFAKRGRRLSSPHFAVVAPVDARGYAVVVSKKTARLSVVRHRIKRKVTAALHALPFPNALIVYPRASVDRLPAADIRAELAGLLSQISF